MNAPSGAPGLRKVAMGCWFLAPLHPLPMLAAQRLWDSFREFHVLLILEYPVSITGSSTLQECL